MDKVPKQIFENIVLLKTFKDECLALDTAKNVRYKVKLEKTKNKYDKLSLVPCEPNTARIDWETLTDRYDMDKQKWSGHTEWYLNNTQKQLSKLSRYFNKFKCQVLGYCSIKN